MADEKQPRKEMTDKEWVHWYVHKLQDLQKSLVQLSNRNYELEQQNRKNPLAQLTPLQIETRDKLLQTLLDLIPQAQRNAKRGKPGLLRLIARTLHIKF